MNDKRIGAISKFKRKTTLYMLKLKVPSLKLMCVNAFIVNVLDQNSIFPQMYIRCDNFSMGSNTYQACRKKNTI